MSLMEKLKKLIEDESADAEKSGKLPEKEDADNAPLTKEDIQSIILETLQNSVADSNAKDKDDGEDDAVVTKGEEVILTKEDIQKMIADEIDAIKPKSKVPSIDGDVRKPAVESKDKMPQEVRDAKIQMYGKDYFERKQVKM